MIQWIKKDQGIDIPHTIIEPNRSLDRHDSREELKNNVQSSN